MINSLMEKIQTKMPLFNCFAFAYAFFFFYSRYFKNLTFDIINHILLLVAMWILYSSQYRFSRVAKWITIYMVLGVAITFYHGIPEANLRLVVRCVRQLVFLLYIDYLLQTSPTTVWREILWGIGFWVGLDLMSVFLFPDGLYRRYESNKWSTWLASVSWLYGHKNVHALYFLLAQLLLWLNYETKTIKLNKKYYFGLCLIPLIASLIMRSSTTVTAMLLVGAGLAMGFKIIKKPPIRLKPEYVVLGYLCLVGLYIILNQEVVRNFIGYDYSKLLSFTGRKTIWGRVLAFVPDHLLLGIGMVDLDRAAVLLKNTFFCNAHNTFIDVLWKGGLVYLAVFLVIIGDLCRSIKKVADTRIANLLMLVFMALLAQMSMESFVFDIKLFLVILLMVNIAENWDNKNQETEILTGMWRSQR